jgi:aryl-alcohol dehydrogenase-like predicted oxidoreductase
MRVGMPRFQGEALAANLKLLDAFTDLARAADCTPAQLCLAWLLHKDPIIVPIPGTGDPDHAVENAKAAEIRLSPETLAQLEELVNAKTVSGPRYAPAMQASIDTED